MADRLTAPGFALCESGARRRSPQFGCEITGRGLAPPKNGTNGCGGYARHPSAILPPPAAGAGAPLFWGALAPGRRAAADRAACRIRIRRGRCRVVSVCGRVGGRGGVADVNSDATAVVGPWPDAGLLPTGRRLNKRVSSTIPTVAQFAGRHHCTWIFRKWGAREEKVVAKVGHSRSQAQCFVCFNSAVPSLSAAWRQ